MKRSLMVLLVMVCSLALVAPAVQAETDFAGEQITWIIPFKVGGGSDVWSRIYAPYLTKYLPGNPVVAIKNMPGGNILISNAEGEDVSAEATLNAAIQLRNVRARNVELRALYGTISATNVECDGCEFNTFGGDIEFSGTLRRNARYDVVSNSGNIRMLVDGNVGFDLEAVGNVVRVPDFQLKSTPSPSTAPGSGRSVLGTYGDASAIISLRTFTGSVTVARPPAGPPR